MLSSIRNIHRFLAVKTFVALAVTPGLLLNSQSLASSKLDISIRSPRDRSSVSGTVSVSAMVIAHLGGARVQFFVDSVPIGEAVTSAPYVINWNTGSISDGAHNLSAVVQDVGANRAVAS